jgi:multifunctional cyclase/dehydratase/O-methyltransferase
MGAETVTGGPPAAGTLPAPVQLALLTNGKRVSQVLYVIAALSIADRLAKGPATAAELAEPSGADADALYRVLRVAAVIGVVREDAGGTFAATDMTEFLRGDVPYSMRDLMLFNGSEQVWRPYGDILHTVRTGEPAFDHVFGRPFFDHLRADPEAAERFDGAMAQMSRTTAPHFLTQYDFTRFRRIADIGGGQGFFLTQILNAAPEARGVLFDRPEVLVDARERLAHAGVAERVDIVTGDFFAEVPAGCDAYVIKQVLHDWDDARATEILRRIRAAIGESDARLVICEHVLAGPGVWDQGKFLDLDMMLRFAGRERTEPEWERLLHAAGFTLATRPITGRWAVIEGVPA